MRIHSAIYACLLTLLAVSARADQIEGCGPELEKAPYSFREIRERWGREAFHRESKRLNHQDLAVFWYEGWPAAQQLALSEGTDVKAMLLEAAGEIDHITDAHAKRQHGEYQPLNFKFTMNLLLSSLEDVAPEKGLDNRLNRMIIEHAAEGLRSLANMLIEVEGQKLSHPTFDPFAPMNGPWVEYVIQRARTIALDFAVDAHSRPQ